MKKYEKAEVEIIIDIPVTTDILSSSVSVDDKAINGEWLPF